MSPAALIAALAIDRAVEEATRDAAVTLVREWSQIFPASGDGRTYTQMFITVGGNRVIPWKPRKGSGFSASHTASKPGQAPAVDTGNLRASIGMEKIDGATWKVGSGAKYAKYLEFGVGPNHKFGPHPGGIEIEPRPHARAAVNKAVSEGKLSESIVNAMQFS